MSLTNFENLINSQEEKIDVSYKCLPSNARLKSTLDYLTEYNKENYNNLIESEINKEKGYIELIEGREIKIYVRYHKEDCNDLIELEINPKGDFIDLRCAENVTLKSGEFKLISLGISVKLPEGYYAEMVPRSSTFKNFGILMTNSIGIIDESYCGDNDIWRFPALAMRDTEIHINDRIAQFRIVKKKSIEINKVDKLYGEDRGGIGSTGIN